MPVHLWGHLERKDNIVPCFKRFVRRVRESSGTTLKSTSIVLIKPGEIHEHVSCRRAMTEIMLKLG